MNTLKIPIEMTKNLAWFLREQLRPGPAIGDEHPMSEGREKLRDLRMKIDALILRFQDEEDLETAEMRITQDEAWMIDHTVNYDGPDGTGTKILIQIFRGLWAEEMGLPVDVVEDPRQDWSNEMFKNMVKERENTP